MRGRLVTIHPHKLAFVPERAQSERARSARQMPCPHGRRRSVCKECGGSGICEHGRQRSQCKECGGSSICEHGRQRSGCKECGGHVVILEAIAVEEFEGKEEPHELPATVQSRVVVRPRGGKRKR